jgi:hypothetical protein
VPFVLALAACAGSAGVRVATGGDGAIVRVTCDGAPFAVVQVRAEPRPFVFPVIGPGGTALTRSFPMADVLGETNDHPHHVSLWFAHGSVNGFDFWQGTAHRERQVLVGAPTIAIVDGRAHVRCTYHWLADADTLVATEDRELVFGAADSVRTIDAVVTLRPGTAPLVFGDTKEGTFALRVRPELVVDNQAAKAVLVNSEGQRGADVWGKRARWIDDAGTVDGAAAGIAMFDHPKNHGHPTWWHARTYGLLAANPFGVHDFEKKPAHTGDLTVPVGGALTLRYRVLLHGAGWDAARIEAAWRAWAAN